MQKIYCYIDETGQDAASDFFIVVAVVSDKEQNLLREQLIKIEFSSKIGKRKWHKSQPNRRNQYLKLILEKGIGEGEVYFARYKKPLPYFLPMLEIIERAIFAKIKGDYKTIIYIDGIDKKKAGELTNALRLQKIKLEFIRSARDEGEPLIRLADRWAGCIRASFLKGRGEVKFFSRAKNTGYLIEIKNPFSRG
ncbi:MAG: DUF3800 domain-containing protein [Candidatus Nealsonbacteria bacterium]